MLMIGQKFNNRNTLIENWFYKGMTHDINRRIKQHINGKSPTTKQHLPLKLVFVQICKNRLQARLLEKYLKSGSGREIINQISVK